MYLLLPLTKGYLSNVASFLTNKVVLLGRDCCIRMQIHHCRYIILDYVIVVPAF